MKVNLKKQQGSFFAEIGAVVASISILTLISTNYMDSMAGRAQVAEAFVLMQPIVENVNYFYSQHGKISSNSDVNANYPALDVYDNDKDGNSPQDYAGRFVETVGSLTNGVVYAKMNPQFDDSDYSKGTVGKVSNVQTAIQGEYIYLIPFLIGDSSTDPSENTTLRWACVTTIDAHPPTGNVFAPLKFVADDTATETVDEGVEVINEQYFYAPGCVVISLDQAKCIDSNSSGTCQATGGAHQGPVNWNVKLQAIMGNPA
jgi:Tfp pilus assembly protein PilE